MLDDEPAAGGFVDDEQAASTAEAAVLARNARRDRVAMPAPYALGVRFVRVGVVLALLLTLTACSDAKKPRADSSSSPSSASPPGSSSATPECAKPHTAGQSTEILDFQGVSRTYELYVPAAYDGTRDVPVVFDFHGFGSNAKEQMAYGNFKPEADRDDFLIVAPDGQGETGRHFNLVGEPALQDDLAMVGALLDHVEATLCIDAKRVYATGMSDGGAMTSFLACRQSDRFAAFGPVAVILFLPGCNASRPVPITAFMGTADPVVPFDGGQVHCCGGVTLGAAPDAMAKWAEHDGCGATYTDERLGTEVRKRTWSGCQRGGDVTFFIIDGGGHTWPGSIPLDRLGMTTKQIDASATLWDFFKSHSLA